MKSLITQNVHDVTDVDLICYTPDNSNCVTIGIDTDGARLEIALFFGDEQEKAASLIDALRTLSI